MFVDFWELMFDVYGGDVRWEVGWGDLVFSFGFVLVVCEMLRLCFFFRCIF